MAAVGDGDLGLAVLVVRGGGHSHIIKQPGLPGDNRYGYVAEFGVDFAGADGVGDENQIFAGCIGGAGGCLRLDDDDMTE